MRRTIYAILFLCLGLIAGIYPFWHGMAWFLILVLPLLLVALYDHLYSHHNVLKNYPVIGHLRYMLEFISPEIHQYFIEGPFDGRPFNREQRKIIYDRAEKTRGSMPFGTLYDMMGEGMEFVQHSLEPKQPDDSVLKLTLGGPQCSQPYTASRLNISAMSFGSLSANAVRALNRGARLGGFFHNTGEGGLSRHHLAEGGDICWQIGTGYFGCRTDAGEFDTDQFTEQAGHDVVKLIEVKLSQGAKPSHGGLLPGAKVNEEIAQARKVPAGEDCVSPPAHSAFSGPVGLLEFIARLRRLSNGKPVGFKLCIGRREEFMAIVKAMRETGIQPDFITVDGSEGGTGAAPFEFSDRLGVPLVEALSFVHNTLVGAGLRDSIRVIASGKISTGFDILAKLALGADMVNMARPMMFALGCIQARRCDENTCPSGVATQDTQRGKAVDVVQRGQHVCNFHAASLRSFVELLGAMGLTHPAELRPDRVFRRLDNGRAVSYAELFPPLAPGCLIEGEDVPDDYAGPWQRAGSGAF